MSLSTVAQFGQLIPQHPEREAYNVHSWPRKHWINCRACVTPLCVAASGAFVITVVLRGAPEARSLRSVPEAQVKYYGMSMADPCVAFPRRK